MLSPVLGFEIFDDVAAFWFFQVVLGIIVVPRAVILGRAALARSGKPEQTGEHENPCECSLCVAKKARLAQIAQANRRKAWLSFWNVLWLACALTFVWMFFYMGSMETREMASFDPFKILGVETDATAQEIKRAYRKQSVIYHPDKNPDNPEAANKFMLLAKALATLTDEATRENWEKYGNPDGYQGASVTIGLPSFLTDAGNEQLVLLVYLGFLVVLPVVVGIWWTRARSLHESGVLNVTLQNMVRKVHENSTPKTLVDVLAMSAEYSGLCPRTGVPQEEADEVRRLLVESRPDVLPKTTKGQRVTFSYYHRALALLNAHVAGSELSPKLDAAVRERMLRDLGFMLEKSPKVVDLMTDLCASRQHMRATMACVEMSQLLAQGLPYHSPPLLQLPHLTRKDADLLAKKGGASTVRRLLELPAAKRKKILRLGQSNGLSVAEWNEAARAAATFPDIDVSCRPHVVGSDDQTIYEGDVVTLELRLRRTTLGSMGLSGVVDEAGLDADEDGGGDENDAAAAAAAAAAASGAGRRKLELEAVDTSKEDERGIKKDDPMDLRWRDFDMTKKKKLDRARRSDPGRVAHAPRFPVPRRETWYVILVDLDMKRMTVQRVKHFNEAGQEQVDIQVGIPKGLRGRQRSFEVHVLCDSYLGCDVRGLPLRLPVADKDPAPVLPPPPAGQEDEEDEIDLDAEEEEEEGVWYLFYCASVQELLLNIFLLALLGVFMFNFLYAKGWLTSVARWVDPFWVAFRSFVTRYVYDLDDAGDLL